MGLEIIEDETDRLSNMVEELLDVSKIINGIVKLNKDNCDLEVFIEYIETLMKARAIKEDKTFIVKGEKNIGNAYFDVNKIKQVLINLIKNSIEALEKEKNKQIKVILKQSKKYTTIQIIDNGCGISSQNIKKIGEPFFTTKEKGTGLGVALSKEIIELHNGRINYESNGNGSIATIKIANHI